ncbi:MAG TPA: radical SAM protein [Chthoniobacterales bacterium]
MGDHLFFCSDLARRDPTGERIERLEGWCLATSPIRALYLAPADLRWEQVPFGFERHDVGAAHPGYPGGAQSGFRLTTASRALHGETELWVELKAGWHRVPVRLETRDVQQIELNESTARAVGPDADGPELRFERSLGKAPGLTLRLDIINKCNLRCVMCHFSDDAIFKRPTQQLTTDEFRRLFDQIGPSVRQVMLSCGDEPLISKHLPGILDYLAREHPQVEIEFCTNAMLMRAPIRNKIIETGVARLLFSIDAVSKELLESIRVGCRYEQLVGNIMALRDLRVRCGVSRPAFVFNFVMMNRNIHEAPAFLKMAQTLGAESIDFRHVVPIGTWFAPDDLLSNHPGKYNFYRPQISAEAKRLGMAIYLPPPFVDAPPWDGAAEQPPIRWEDFERVEPDPAGENVPHPPSRQHSSWEGTVAEEFATTFCNRPFSEIMVRDQNEVLPCPWHEKPLGFLSEGKTLDEIFHGEEFQRLRRNMLRPEGDPGCANCPIKSHHLPTSA